MGEGRSVTETTYRRGRRPRRARRRERKEPRNRTRPWERERTSTVARSSAWVAWPFAASERAAEMEPSSSRLLDTADSKDTLRTTVLAGPRSKRTGPSTLQTTRGTRTRRPPGTPTRVRPRTTLGTLSSSRPCCPTPLSQAPQPVTRDPGSRTSWLSLHRDTQQSEAALWVGFRATAPST